ncbi:MAG: TIGR03087 family PEP-CTERM/XrtA system glycosyltransferase [Pseudomonadota bacterium]
MSGVLFLAHRVPFPPNRGDKIRSHHLLKKLATLGSVHVGCFAENSEDRAAVPQIEAVSASSCVVNRSKSLALAGAQAVLQGNPVSLSAFYSAELERWVAKTIARESIHAIVVFSGQMGQYIPAKYKGRVVTDLCDVDSAKFERYAASGDRRWLNAREARLLAKEEERLAQRSDATVLISDAEVSLFRSRLKDSSKANLVAMGNGIDARFFDPDRVEPHPDLAESDGPHFVFTGQMDYRPNEAAILWAIDHFLPVVRARYPKARLHVVGRNPTRALRQRSGRPGARVWGEVPDTRPFLAGASCVVAPLMIARGVQNKVLEAMAMARPVLLTPQAATGIDAVDGAHWMTATADASAMADRWTALVSNLGAARSMGLAARRFVLEKHSWAERLAGLEALVTGEPAEGESRDAA